MKWLVRLKKEVGILKEAGNFSFTILSSYQITLELRKFLLTIVVILESRCQSYERFTGLYLQTKNLLKILLFVTL